MKIHIDYPIFQNQKEVFPETRIPAKSYFGFQCLNSFSSETKENWRIGDNLIIVLLIGITLFSCETREKRQAITLIHKSIEAHGGQEAWSAMPSISLEKTTWLYNETGQEESHLLQQQVFRLKPYFEAKMNWKKDDVNHQLVFDGITTKYWMGENEIQNEGFLQSKKRELDAAFYVLDKPFSLLDEHLNIKHQGRIVLADGQEVETVQVIDGEPEDQNVDVWWYYFHPNTHVLLAYKVKTSDHFSLVYNRELDNRFGILFPSKRESFRVDSLGNHLFLRAVYEYVEYEVVE